MVMVTYIKSNGRLFTRIVKSAYGLRVGDTTSMGWQVVSIHYKYEGNYYTYPDYCKMIRGKQIKKKEHKLFRYLIRQLQKIA